MTQITDLVVKSLKADFLTQGFAFYCKILPPLKFMTQIADLSVKTGSFYDKKCTG